MPARAWSILVALACFAAVGAALVSQHLFDMQPCPWCILQRLIFAVIGVLALLAALLRGVPRALLGAGMLLLAGGGAAAAAYQHFVAAKSQSCNLTLADRIVSGIGVDRLLPEVFEVRASCADAAVNLAGVPYEFWSLGLFVLVGAMALLVMLGARR
ncbi:MAG: disulfide bond formation protein B [Piscinibacter sp.]|nr:disulfide bond formation protein B [Piscinibacter sp.]